MDRAAWQAIVPGVAKSQTRLKQLTQQEGVTTLELTVLLVHLAIVPPPRLSVKGLAPSVASGGSQPLDRCPPSPPPPQLLASKIKLTFLSVCLACLLALEQAAVSPAHLLVTLYIKQITNESRLYSTETLSVMDRTGKEIQGRGDTCIHVADSLGRN